MPGWFDKITGGGGSTPLSPTVTHVQLTDTGERKLKELEPIGRKFDVVSAVKILQPCSAAEVAEKLHWPENKVQHVLEELAREGWVQKAN